MVRLLPPPWPGDRPAGRRTPGYGGNRKVNLDDEPELAEKFDVDTIPSLLMFKDGHHSELLVNPGSKAEIQKWIKEV